jgi:chitinase
VESAETFKLNLSSPTQGATLGTPNTATATINDNDSGGVCSSVSFSVNDPPLVTEGSPLTFTVSKAGSTSSSCSVSYATADGSAHAPAEYTAKSGTLTFTSAQTSQNVTVTTIDNLRATGNHTVFFNLTTATNGASISDSQGVGSIGPSDPVCKTCTQSVDPGTEGLSTDSTTSTDPPPTGG